MIDREHFEDIVSEYIDAIYAFVFRFVRNADEAEDIVQETFVKAWKKLATFKEDQNFKTWLFIIARNTTYDFLRKKRHIAFSELDTEAMNFEEHIKDEELLPDEIFEQKEFEAKIDEALETLSPEYREVIILKQYQDMTFEEIAEIMKKPMNTVKSRYRRGLQKMKDTLSNTP